MIMWRRFMLCITLAFTASMPAVSLATTLSGQTAPLAHRTVHVVFGNHLDIGFDNIEPWVGYDSHVLNKYFHEYLPRAVDVADWMRRVGHGDSYVYTTHAYLLSLFLDCPPGMGLRCPGPVLRAKVLNGALRGDITWHAHPHNAQYELYDSSLLEFSLQLVHDLDDRLGMPRKRTLVLRDVPGLTRAIIPVLAARGVEAVSVGVNAGSAPPGVPPFTPFLWRDEESGQQLLAFWHPGGYGGLQGPLALDPPEQCIQAPGLSHVLCTSWRNDNQGPPDTVLEPLRIFQLLRQQWTAGSAAGDGATARQAGGQNSAAIAGSSTVVQASSFDKFVGEVLSALPRLNLTVVTAEIGDTWVFGAAADPLRTANFRAAARARAACIADTGCPSETPAFYNFSRLLLKVPEHTWGVDIKKTLHDFKNWTNDAFHPCLPPDNATLTAPVDLWGSHAVMLVESSGSSINSSGSGGSVALWGIDDASLPVRRGACPNYDAVVHSWERQAAYVTWAMQALPVHHPVLTAYGADQQQRQQLAAISAEALTAAGARGFNVAPQGGGAGRAAALAASRRLKKTTGTAQRGARAPAARRRVALRRYLCGDWLFELDETQGALTSLQRLHGTRRTPGNDWARVGGNSGSGGGSSGRSVRPVRHRYGGGDSSNAQPAAGVLARVRYSVFTESSYDVVWNNYAWQQPMPWWFPLDFGKVNSSTAWPQEVHQTARLRQVFEEPPINSSDGLMGTNGDATPVARLALRYSLPHKLVQQAGAPRRLWVVYSCPAGTPPALTNGGGSSGSKGDLEIALIWQGKTPTRLPEALWFSFVPAQGSVDPTSWRFNKLSSWINPAEVLLNGSQSMHAVSDGGATVRSADGREALTLRSLDAPLISPGEPTPFPNGISRPVLDAGVHWNVMNNVWGTNYAMWVPYARDQVNLAFRFSISATREVWRTQ